MAREDAKQTIRRKRPGQTEAVRSSVVPAAGERIERAQWIRKDSTSGYLRYSSSLRHLFRRTHLFPCDRQLDSSGVRAYPIHDGMP